ncbi:hypothetical protein [Roseateles sp.]|uniref:hypothetical protein n=1 Tax=Roseateles sp. TaxID=1971397 RepID=UPI0035A1C37C
MEDPWIVDRPLLADVCPAFARAATTGCQAIGRLDLAIELARVVLPPQIVSGSPASFSFLAYPVPRLTYEERKLLEVRDFERVQVPVGTGLIQLELDAFGKIGWFYVERLPEHFRTIVQGAQQHAL